VCARYLVIYTTFLRSDDRYELGEWSNPVGNSCDVTSIGVIRMKTGNIHLSGNSSVGAHFISFNFQNRNKVMAENAIAVLRSNGVPH